MRVREVWEKDVKKKEKRRNLFFLTLPLTFDVTVGRSVEEYFLQHMVSAVSVFCIRLPSEAYLNMNMAKDRLLA